MPSVAERTMRPQLQYFTRFRVPIQLFVAFAILSGFSIVGHLSSTSVSALATTVWKAFTKPDTPRGTPFLNSFFDIITSALNIACLRVRVYIKVPIRWQQMLSRGPEGPRSDDTYATPRAEAKYWRAAGRYRRRLYGGNDTSYQSNITTVVSRDDTPIPLVIYYTPRLLPMYRDRDGGKHGSRRKDMDAIENWISPRTFCKWHRMVFQDSRHPTLAQAVVQMKYYSNRDLCEIRRIARLLPDEQVFDSKIRGTGKARKMTKYSEMWASWLDNKGMDLTIVFE